MERIRIGNNIAISWALYELNGKVHSLEGKNIQLFVATGGLKEPVFNYTIQGNVISWVFLGTDQHKTGVYKLILVETDELSGAQAIDVAEAFQLVGENVTVAEAVTNPTNVSVRSVLTYSNLVGVDSVDVIESTVDGGTNYVTINLVDGSSFTIPIKNGSKGDKGDKGDTGATGPKGDKGDTGERGPAGIEEAEVTVDATTGTPSVEASIEDGVLSLSFSGIKGEKGDKGDKGNTGSSVDFPYELVTDVETDDDEKGLAASQGVVLDNKISQLGQEVRTVESDIHSIILLDIGNIDSATGQDTAPGSYNNRAKTGYISSPFSVEMNEGYLINQGFKYQRGIDGEITFVGTVQRFEQHSSINVAEDGYIYRFTIKKADNEDFTPQDVNDAVAAFDGSYNFFSRSISVRTIVNVNAISKTPSALYTLSTAAAAVPESYRIAGCVIIFRASLTLTQFWQVWQYCAGDISYWDNANYWKQIELKYEANQPFSVKCGLNPITGKNSYSFSLYLSTPFLLAKTGISLKVTEANSNAACCFYDEHFNYISKLALSNGTQVITLGNAGYEIPNGAVYFRASGSIDNNCYIQGECFAVASPYYVENWQSSLRQEFTHFFVSGKAYSVGSLNVGDIVTIGDNSSIDCIKIKVLQGDIFNIKGRGASGPRLWAWCDTDMKLISKADDGITYEGDIVAPANGYLVFNNFRTYYSKPYVARNRYANEEPTYNPCNWLAMGDSITQGWYSYKDETYPHGHGVLNAIKGWVYKMSVMTGKNVTNKGIGGTGYVCVGTTEADINARQLIDTLTAEDFEGIGLVTLAYGINDYKKGNITLGTMSDDVATGGTVVSNMRYVIEKIQSFAPLAKIIVITPFNAAGYYGQELGDESSNYAIGHTVNGKTLQDFYDAFVEVCEYYGIQYIDATHTSLISRKAIPEQLPDGIHPSEDAHTIIAREFSQRITMY